MKISSSMEKFIFNPGTVFLLSLIVAFGLVVYRGSSDNRQSKKISSHQSMHSKMKNVKSSPIKFRDVTLESGIDFRHIQGGMKLSAISEVIGSGACTADINGDGFLDIYAVNGSGFTHFFGKKWWWYEDPSHKLYLNNQDGTFKDITRKAGAGTKGWGMGCAFGDYDNDGHPDLYVTHYGANVLYHNNGDGTFTDMTKKAGVGDEGWGTSVAWGDYNNDGNPDIYVANYLEFNKTMNPGEPNRAFKINLPLLMNSALFDSQRNVLYRNNGNGTFTDVTGKTGVGNAPGKSMGVVFFDYNSDGFQDIYVANDKSRNVLYRNNRNGTFADAGGALMLDSPLSAMGIAIGDYDNDGDMDILSTYSQSDTNILYRNNLKSVPVRAIREPNKNKGFSDITVDSGLGEDVSVGYFGWGAGFVDFDNDGHLDLFVANGHPMRDFDNPQTTIGQKNQVFRNNGDETFSAISTATGSGLQNHDTTRGAVFGDFDNDGDVDIFLMNNNDYASFFENKTENNNHWLNIKLQGTNSGRTTAKRAVTRSVNENVSTKTQSSKFEMQSTRDALGARVKVITGDLSQVREVRSGSGYLSQSDTRLHFGLTNHEKADLIEIKWPSGKTQRFRDVEANRFVNIIEGKKEVIEIVTVKENGERGGEEAGRKTFRKESLEESKRARDDIFVDDVKALGILKDKRGTEILFSLLKDQYAEIRKEAVAALGNSGDSRGIKPLLILLNREKSPLVIKEIIKALSNFESDRIILPLINVLESAGIKAASTTGNGEIGREAAKSLSVILEREQNILRSTMLKKRLAVVPLIKSLQSPDELIREYAVKGLGFSESYRAVVPVMNMFGDESPAVRKSAVRAAGLLKDKRAVGPLLGVLKNNNEETLTRVQAVLALRKLKSDFTLKPLFEVFDSQNDNDSRYRAILVISSLLRDKESFLIKKDMVISYLQNRLKDRDLRIRKEVIKMSSLLKTKGHIDIIHAGLNDDSLEVRREAAAAVNKSGNYKLVKALRKRINDKDSVIRKEALLSLSKYGNSEDAVLLRKIVANEKDNMEIRMAALSSLIKIDSPTAINIIEELMKSDDLQIRRESLRILGLTNDKKVIKLLLISLEESEERALLEEAVLSLTRFLEENEVFYSLVKKLKDKSLDKEVRITILSVLSTSSQAEEVFPYLINIIIDRDDDLKLDAIKVIAEKRDAKNVETLLKKVFDKIIK